MKILSRAHTCTSFAALIFADLTANNKGDVAEFDYNTLYCNYLVFNLPQLRKRYATSAAFQDFIDENKRLGGQYAHFDNTQALIKTGIFDNQVHKFAKTLRYFTKDGPCFIMHSPDKTLWLFDCNYRPS